MKVVGGFPGIRELLLLRYLSFAAALQELLQLYVLLRRS
jgi:hypothetical protein